MQRTEVGYGGGLSANPTYHDLGSHAEVLQIEFDPRVVSFGDLLARFWAGHDPRRSYGGSQYRAILLCENQDQLEQATHSVTEMEEGGRGPVRTEIVVGKPFHPAEAYHQKWKLRRHRELFFDLAKNYDSEAQLLRSLAATRLNALVAGHLEAAQIERGFEGYGLSAKGMAALRSFVPRRLLARTGP